ncbi:MAG: PAS domain S-box protein, partial [Gammaproteobacteria bacterium]|nr:PAS domain S-box protein [Gammaproteobacteria bacterium]
MNRDLRNEIRKATEKSGIGKLDFVELLKLIDEHYDRMEETITQSLSNQKLTPSTTPIEVIFDSVTEALLSVSEEGTIRNANKVCSRYFGIDKEGLIGRSIISILPEARNRTLADFLQPFQSDIDDTNANFCGGEVRATRASGEIFDAEINSSCLKVGDERVFVISIRDVTGRKQAERSLKENEERYRALVENAPEAIVVLDVDSNRFVDANENASQLFNLPRKRLLSIGPKAISPRMQPDGSPSFGVRRGFIDRALNGEHPVFEWVHKNLHGREFPCEVRFSRLPSEERRLIRVSITDIAERKRNDQFGYAQNKILEMIAASAPSERTLRSLCRCVEKISPDMLAAVMRLDIRSQTLSVEQAPSLPEPFRLALEFLKVEEAGVTCGAAVFGNREKFTVDLAADKAWSGVHELVAQHDLRAAWSFPLHGAHERIIGTLDVYLRVSRQPTTDELDKLNRMARLASLTIKKQLDEEQLKQSESRYRGLFENVVDGVFITSREGEIITVNPALVEMLGYESAEELKRLGRTSMLYVNPIDRERVFARLEEQGYIKNFEYRLRRKDGKEIVVLENSRAVYDDGKIVAHEGTITDITERKIAETRVFEEKERAQVTLQSIGDGV